MLTLEGFAKQYLYGARLFGGVDVSFGDGEVVAVLGGEGSGKTSFLKALCGAEKAEGKVLLNGAPIARRTDDVIMVFDDGAVFGHRTVYDNLAYPLVLRKTDKAEIASRVINAAERMGIGACLNMRARALSPVERRRMSLARLLVRDARLCLIDEPAARLTREDADAVFRDFLPVVRDLAAAGATVIYSTPYREEAFAASDRTVVLVGGEVKQTGTREELLYAPASVWAAEAADPDYNVLKCVLSDENGRLKLVFGEDDELDAECLRVRTEESYTGKEVLVGWHPESAAASGEAAWKTESTALAVGDAFGVVLHSVSGIKERCGKKRGFVHVRPDISGVTLFDRTNECSIMKRAKEGTEGEEE